MVTIGTLFGSLMTGPLMDKFGRRTTCQASCVPLIVAWILICLAQNVEALYAGRLLAGLGGGKYYTVFWLWISNKNMQSNRIYFLYTALPSHLCWLSKVNCLYENKNTSRNILLSELKLNGLLTFWQSVPSSLKKQDMYLVTYEEEDTELIQRVLNLITCQICEQTCFLYRFKLHLEKFLPTHSIAPMFSCSGCLCRSSFNHLHA